MHYEFFPPEEQELNKELVYHPELLAKIARYPQQEKEMILSEIAAHCGIVLEGAYFPEDLTKLCGVLVEKLRSKRPGRSGNALILLS